MSANKRALKILITPNYAAPYDQRMVRGLATGFDDLGHQALALSAPISAREVAKQCEALAIDVVVQVNRTRHPEVALPPKVRYVSWFQDVFPETTNGFSERFLGSDILYALGDAGVLGLDVALPCYVGSLVSGVDKSVLDYAPKSNCGPVDFSLCGFIPPPPLALTQSIGKDLAAILKLNPWLGVRRLAAIVRRVMLGYYRRPQMQSGQLMGMMHTVESLYRPLYGELDIHQLTQAMRKNFAADHPLASGSGLWSLRMEQIRQRVTLYLMGQKPVRGAHGPDSAVPDFSALSAFEQSVNYFAREYPRLLDRKMLVQQALQVSNSLELHGPGWNMHPEFRPYAKGMIETQVGLLDVYHRTRITLANNTHGLGLHSRTLECMAVRGFVLTHESPHDHKLGGIQTSFEPGVHYGIFTPENLQQEARRWLADDVDRDRVGERAAAIIRQKHCWHHRAQQVLDDLKK